MKVNIYMASSVKSLKRQNGVVGFVIDMEEFEKTVTQFGSVKDATANQSQILCLKYALQRINQAADLEIYTDCRYLASAFENDWISGWIGNDWKTVKGTDVANKEEWQEVLKRLNGRVPVFKINSQHQYKNWLESEVERRSKKYV